MAILATRRRWEVTRRWAAAGSSCSRQRLASMNSSSLASIGNLRISVRYRDRPPSGDITESAVAEAILVFPLLGGVVGRAIKRAQLARPLTTGKIGIRCAFSAPKSDEGFLTPP